MRKVRRFIKRLWKGARRIDTSSEHVNGMLGLQADVPERRTRGCRGCGAGKLHIGIGASDVKMRWCRDEIQVALCV